MRIVVAGLNRLMREALWPYLGALGPAVTLMETAADDLLKTVGEGEEAVLCLLMCMPSAVDLAKQIKRSSPRTKVVVLSCQCDAAKIKEFIGFGVDGVIPASFGIEALRAALNLVLDGERFIPSAAVTGESRMARSSPAKEGLDKGKEGFPLMTVSERNTIAMLRHGMSNKGIARELGISEATVKAHLRNAYRKMGVCNRTQASHCGERLLYEG
ncbi:MAG: response regulator transcription factor [Magnetospirillum sp.]|nr:response regulator transcription factor [Magnetospirillum sp.]